MSRSGYVNLLQPQDRRSKNPGDSQEAVLARRRFVDGGYDREFQSEIIRDIESLSLKEGSAILDAGCGEGTLLGTIQKRLSLEAHGVDIAVPAIDAAARRYPDFQWIVANADRGLPYPSGSFDLVMSITSRRNPAEFARTLTPTGTLLVVLPGDDDLHEVREAVQGAAVTRSRVSSTVVAYESHFELENVRTIRHTRTLPRNTILDLLAMTYRGARGKERARVEALSEMEVTMTRDVLRFRMLGR